MFRAPGLRPEPCPEEAWNLGPLLDCVPRVAQILAREGSLVLVVVENPRNPRWVYIHTPSGGGNWRQRGGSLMVNSGIALAVSTLLDGFTV